MIISNTWTIKDDPSGLALSVIVGKTMDRLHIESLDGKMNRDFWFLKDGTFDGTGSTMCDQNDKVSGHE